MSGAMRVLAQTPLDHTAHDEAIVRSIDPRLLAALHEETADDER